LASLRTGGNERDLENTDTEVGENANMAIIGSDLDFMTNTSKIVVISSDGFSILD